MGYGWESDTGVEVASELELDLRSCPALFVRQRLLAQQRWQDLSLGPGRRGFHVHRLMLLHIEDVKGTAGDQSKDVLRIQLKHQSEREEQWQRDEIQKEETIFSPGKAVKNSCWQEEHTLRYQNSTQLSLAEERTYARRRMNFESLRVTERNSQVSH
ncbi:hypothetical protein EYF80_029034 [Liparis tanakae]|uniref:Uncharacterized protein n=1 Tax=Liparis tanakae TaxID=230148 RepID=A0A4Z2H5C9_9TELE|nr:hypothetical protein EYF80_029034 [Liparis tanakae]